MKEEGSLEKGKIDDRDRIIVSFFLIIFLSCVLHIINMFI